MPNAFASRSCPSQLATLLAASFLVIACNASFWKTLAAATSYDWAALAVTGIALIAFLNALLSLLSFRPVFKPALTMLFLVTAGAAFFMDQYGVGIDVGIIQNVMETDRREAMELISWRLAAYLLMLGVFPSLVMWKTPLRFSGLRSGSLRSGLVVVSSLTVATALVMVNFKTLAPAVREHRELRFLLTPSNYLQALNKYLTRGKPHQTVVAPIGLDAVKGTFWQTGRRRAVSVVILGETARAANFSLNGYARHTNPELAAQADLINFRNVQSCGTATAISVPCIFSGLGRDRYSEDRAMGQQGLLDILSHAGIDVLWRDNNSGCKGVCDRIRYEDLSRPSPGDALCNGEECYDERLLEKLPEIVRHASGDMVIVLHQKGSHGPAYWKRYPQRFERFSPVCKTNSLGDCTPESITAAYDNSILYTDHVISTAIDMLREMSASGQIDTSLLYFSDHGESLGEHNLYLHGAPYIVSPIEQRHVPMMMWLSDSFSHRFHIDQTCLLARTSQSFSHDNVFHSVLGMLNIRTAVYNPALDIFQPCTHAT